MVAGSSPVSRSISSTPRSHPGSFPAASGALLYPHKRRLPMQVDVQQLEPCKVALNIQVPPEQITQTIDNVFNRFAKRTTVPGFRKGKAPRKLAERYIDVDAVREAALDQVIQDAYQEALKETGIQPYEQASVELKEFEEG